MKDREACSALQRTDDGGEERWRVKAERVPVLDLSSLESILVKSVSIEARSAKSLELSRLPWLTLSRSLASVRERKAVSRGLTQSNIFKNQSL